VKRAFTLAEILITLVIITLGMTALLMVFSLATATSRGVEERETAVNIATAKMEQLRNTTYANLAASTEDSSAIISSISGYTVAVTTTKPANPAEVNVTVSWAAKGGNANVSLTTLRANY